LTTTVEIDGYIEQKLDVLVGLGLYATKSEAVRDAVRHLLESVDILSISVDMYAKSSASLGFCAEVAGISCDELMIVLQRKGVKPHLGVDEMSQLEAEANIAAASEALAFEGFSFKRIADLLGGVIFSGRPWPTYLAQAQLDELDFELRRVVLARLGMAESGFTLITGLKGIEGVAIENNISRGEASAILAAEKTKATLVADDHKLRTAAVNSGVRVVSSPALLVCALGRGLITEAEAHEGLERLFSQGYFMPLSPSELSVKKLSVSILRR
jgi:predicted HTH domain antitoxin